MSKARRWFLLWPEPAGTTRQFLGSSRSPPGLPFQVSPPNPGAQLPHGFPLACSTQPLRNLLHDTSLQLRAVARRPLADLPLGAAGATRASLTGRARPVETMLPSGGGVAPHAEDRRDPQHFCVTRSFNYLLYAQPTHCLEVSKITYFTCKPDCLWPLPQALPTTSVKLSPVVLSHVIIALSSSFRQLFDCLYFRGSPVQASLSNIS